MQTGSVSLGGLVIKSVLIAAKALGATLLPSVCDLHKAAPGGPGVSRNRQHCSGGQPGLHSWTVTTKPKAGLELSARGVWSVCGPRCDP